VHQFTSIDDARTKIEAWRVDYNQQRPHGSLGHLTPDKFASQRQEERTTANGRRCSGKADRVSGCSLLRSSLWSELLLNRRCHEVHEENVVRHPVEPEATVKRLRDAGRQLRQAFFGRRHLCRLVLRSFRSPGPRRRLPRRRPFFGLVFAVKTLPSNDWIAERTSCCTRSRITVNKLLCLGIESSLPAADTRKGDEQQR
jgi:hypothetical protein